MPRLREFHWDSWALWTTTTIAKDAPSIIAVDTETTGLGFYDKPFAATLTWRGRDGSLRSGYIDLEDPQALTGRIRRLKAALAGTPAWVFHNAKFDLQKLVLIGALTEEDVAAAEIHDTQTIFHLLDENSPKRLKGLAVTVLGWDNTIEVEIKSGPNKGKKKRVPKEEHHLNAVRRSLGLKKEDGYHLLPREVLIPYALRDTDFTLLLYEALMPRLEAKNDPALMRLYRDSIHLKRVLLRMESQGFELDLPYLDATASEYGVRVMQKWQKVVDLTGKPDLNPGSWQQVQAAFADRGVYLEDTKAETLKALDDPLAVALLDYRDDFKTHTTYLVGLQREHKNGIAHPSFNEDSAKTGRFSSSSPKE